MGGRYCPGDALGDEKSSPSAPRGNRIEGFPKSVRILRSKDFRRVYEHGTRYSGTYFAAFYARRVDAARPGAEGPVGVSGPRIGFTLPRSLGGAVVRNRIKRRVREAVRQRLDRL